MGRPYCLLWVEAFSLEKTEAGRWGQGREGFSYMVQKGLYLAEDGLGHLDGTRPALGLTQLAQGGQVVHGVSEWLVVPVHQAQALRRGHAQLDLSPACLGTGPRQAQEFQREALQSNPVPKRFGFSADRMQEGEVRNQENVNHQKK